MALRLALRRKCGAALQTFRLGLQGVPQPPVGYGSLSCGFQAAVAVAKARPIATAVFVATTKGILADLLAQLVVEGRSMRQALGIPSGSDKKGHPQDAGDGKAWDWRRTAAMATFSGMYCGLFFYWQFAVLFPRIWPITTKTSWRSVLQQVAVDNFLFSTCLYMPVFYATRGAIVESKGLTESLANYAEDFPEVVGCLLKVWVPAGLVNFALMPVWFRTPYNSIVSFFYLAFLSKQSHCLRLD